MAGPSNTERPGSANRGHLSPSTSRGPRSTARLIRTRSDNRYSPEASNWVSIFYAHNSSYGYGHQSVPPDIRFVKAATTDRKVVHHWRKTWALWYNSASGRLRGELQGRGFSGSRDFSSNNRANSEPILRTESGNKGIIAAGRVDTETWRAPGEIGATHEDHKARTRHGAAPVLASLALLVPGS